MRRYTYQNCTVQVNLPNQDTVRKATERFIKGVKNEKEKKKK